MAKLSNLSNSIKERQIVISRSVLTRFADLCTVTNVNVFDLKFSLFTTFDFWRAIGKKVFIASFNSSPTNRIFLEEHLPKEDYLQNYY